MAAGRRRRRRRSSGSSIALLVGSALFQFATGLANAQDYYPFHFNFVVAHYYGALIFIASLALHVVVKLPAMRRAYASAARSGRCASLADDEPEPPDARRLVPSPGEPTLSRRGLLGLVGAGSATLLRGDRRAVDRRPAARARAARAARRRAGPTLPGQQDRRAARGSRRR